MSRAGVKSRRARELATADRRSRGWYRLAEAHAALDACLVACDGCGLVQVAPGPACVLCASETGTYAGEPPARLS